jgi:retron-type reverse transcriptase
MRASKPCPGHLDADIRSFFDEISQEWLIRFLEHRIGDRRIIRLILKWDRGHYRSNMNTYRFV